MLPVWLPPLVFLFVCACIALYCFTMKYVDDRFSELDRRAKKRDAKLRAELLGAIKALESKAGSGEDTL